MFNPREHVTRRNFLIASGSAGVAAVTAFCARPAASPSGKAPAETPAAATATPAVSRPTETPKPIEKGVIGDWRFTPVFVEKPSPGREGYKRLKITMAVQNRGSTLKNGKEVVEDVTFKMQVAGGFTYPDPEDQPVRGTFLGADDFKVPPGFQLPFNAVFEVPLNTQDLKVAVTSRSHPQQPVLWDLEKEFSTPENAPRIQYFPTDERGLKQLGESLQQGPLIITPLGAALGMICDWPDGSWNLGIRIKVENNYGYDLDNPGALFIVFDNEGKTWRFRNDMFGSGILKVPPGTTKIRYIGGIISSGFSMRNSSWARCIAESTIPTPPNELRLLIWLPELTKTQGREIWGVYPLQNLPIGPNTVGSYNFSPEKTFNSK